MGQAATSDYPGHRVELATAQEAVRTARAAADSAEIVRTVVLTQAARRLAADGHTVRGIAAALGISKSHASRLTRGDAIGWALPPGIVESVTRIWAESALGAAVRPPS